MFSPRLLSLAILIALGGCSPDPIVETQPVEISLSQASPQVNLASAEQQLEAAVANFASDFIQLQPAMATSLNLSQGQAGDFQRRLPDYSSQGVQAFKLQMQQAAHALASIEARGLSDEQQRHRLINQVIGQYYAGLADFNAGYIDTWAGHLPYIVNQINGPLIDIPAILADQQTINSLVDGQDYLARLSALALMVGQVQSKVAEDAKEGVILPKALFPNTLKYLANFVASPAAEHSLVTSFATKLSNVPELTPEQVQALTDKAIAQVETNIYPAYRSLTAFMLALEAKAPTEVGIWAQPNGKAFYQHGITYLADSSLGADAIHQLGIDEVTRITKEMDAILSANGYTEGSVGERMLVLNQEPRFLYENSDAGRQQLLNDLSAEIKRVMDKAPSLFSSLPPQEVVVKRVPVETQAGAAGGSYVPPALDGSRAGVYFINLMDMTSIVKYGLKTLTYHEAVPGHHFQIALNMQQTDIGLMRQNASFNAFIEGWALYAEQVAFEMGMYENDPWGNLGRLQAEVYRAARLVVDSGLHHKKWSRAEAISYFATATGSTEANVASAIDRYIAWPGQALGYKLGMLKIVELRELAKTALGDKFDIRQFHDLILLPGARPMSVVEADVNNWIAKKKS
ncbi:protein of unknown function DUF885 [Shewanella denitrificans OS217]|jgi:uncharacterized protein (DUF885 family)|uniref:DUF885 domain-containing protein n=1 Tax=Shewanella denitrificans (strain OS217 / ATCC BAA-1090 / DSM 15013) TaxID=318161 RepID=Q12P49_SHEDO|nr:DUF885 domain-containing protein [Shewanella denitrificans]ABE54777.1 protein of unknown function DUF885 [Shewanella denitrificans OS217]